MRSASANQAATDPSALAVRWVLGKSPIHSNSKSNSSGGGSDHSGTSVKPILVGLFLPQVPSFALLPYDHGYGFGTLGSASISSLRALSPPITLPPLRLRMSSLESVSAGDGKSSDNEDGDEDEDEDMEGEGAVMWKRDRSGRRVLVDKEKVALSGFKEIEAAARGEK
ncbi:hypothetical protein EDD16DRAFT_1788996 [Pisolithus croceorrhizus]|nr:hypothetical protein EDD16DRAFT_1788996 [Pisolithus croceorrhizus]KAI6122947.1 hypothetical protein EV401DRAFT_2164884 [Pisolithus croceorrhizus]